MIERYILEIWTIVLDLGFPLLLGIVIAGVVHAILPTGFVHRNFGSRGLKSVIKATIIGVPLPLCSCGVIPTAVGLKQDGASDGASTSFFSKRRILRLALCDIQTGCGIYHRHNWRRSS